MKAHRAVKLVVTALAAATLACSHPAAPAARGGAGSRPAAGGAPAAPPAAPAASRESGGGGPRPQAPKREHVARSVVVPAGTALEVRLDTTVSSASASPGEIVAAELAAPLEADGLEAAPIGTPVEARVESVVPSGRLARQARLVLTLTAIAPGDRRLAVTTDSLASSGPSHTKRNEWMIGGGAIIGAIAGQLLGGHTRDTLRGAAVGAAAGTGVAAAKGHLDVTIGAGQVLTFTLRHDLTVPR